MAAISSGPWDSPAVTKRNEKAPTPTQWVWAPCPSGGELRGTSVGQPFGVTGWLPG